MPVLRHALNEAEKFYNNAISINPKYFETYNNLMDLFERTNQNEKLNNIEDETILENLPERKEIIEKFLGIEKILTSTCSTPPEKFSIEAASTITEYVSDVDFNKDLKKLKFSDGEIEKILKTLSGDGTIIVQKI